MGNKKVLKRFFQEGRFFLEMIQRKGYGDFGALS